METYMDFKYEQTDSNGIGIIRYIGSEPSVNIPAQINGVPVTYINCDAFSDCSLLTSIIIPDSVKWIGDYLFEGCSRLRWIYIKKSLRARDIIFGSKLGSSPCHKIFRTVQEVKQYFQETLNKLNREVYRAYSSEINVLRNALGSINIADNIVMRVITPAVDAIENLVSLQERKNYFRSGVNLINAMSSKKLDGADEQLQKLQQEEISMGSDLKTNVVALLLLEKMMAARKSLSNSDLVAVKEVAQILSRFKIDGGLLR